MAKVDLTDSHLSLSGANSILGRSVVVHADVDDLGQGLASGRLDLFSGRVDRALELGVGRGRLGCDLP